MNCAKEDSSANAARVHVEKLFIIIAKPASSIKHQAPITKRFEFDSGADFFCLPAKLQKGTLKPLHLNHYISW
jgi:hypothetical protein